MARRPVWGLVFLVVLCGVVASVVWPTGDLPERPSVLREFERRELELRDGVLYARGAEDAFDGLVVERYPGGGKRLAIEVVDGRPDGVSRGWYESGQQEVEEFFVEGVSDGKRTRWFENGEKKSEATIVGGKVEGVFRRWHDNGVKAAEVEMSGGEPHGVSEAWGRDGKPTAKVVMESGEVVSREYFDREGAL